MTKRGQVSSFIAVGMLVLVLFGLFYVWSGKYTSRTGSQESDSGNVRFYFESCQKNAFITAKDMYGISKEKEEAYEEFMDAALQECAQNKEFPEVVVEAGTSKSHVVITDNTISAETIFPVSVKSGSSKTGFDTLTYYYSLNSFYAMPLNDDKITAGDLSFGYSDYIDVFIPKGTLVTGGQGSFLKIAARDPYILEGTPPLVIGNQIFELSPSLKFSQPVTIFIDYSKLGAETDDADEGNFVLYAFDDVSGQWAKVDGSYSDKKLKKVIGKVSHFSYYAVGEEIKVDLKPGLASGCTIQERINYLCGVPCDKSCSRYAAKYKEERAELQELIRLRSSPEYDLDMKVYGSCNLEENCLRCPDACGIAQKRNDVSSSKEATEAVESAQPSDQKQHDCTIQARIDYLCGKCNSGSEDNGIGPYNPSYPNCNIVWSFNRDELSALANARGKGIKTVKDAIDTGLKLQQNTCSCDVSEVATTAQTTSQKPPEIAEKPSGEAQQAATDTTSTSALVEGQQNKESGEGAADEPTGVEEGASKTHGTEDMATAGVQSEPLQAEPQIIMPVAFNIGMSHKERPITVYKFGSGETSVLIIGGIHAGTEGNGVELTRKLKDYYEQNPDRIPEGLTLWIMPVVNPDGLHMKSRFNYESVDINRNWPTSDWSVDTYYARNAIKKGGGGSAPLSEPETQVLSSFVLDKNIDVIISFHSQAGTVDAGRKIVDGRREPIDFAEQIAQIYSRRVGYKYLEEGWSYYPITGSMQDWAAGNNIAAIDVEISTSTLPSNEAESNMKAVEDVLSFVAAYDDMVII